MPVLELAEIYVCCTGTPRFSSAAALPEDLLPCMGGTCRNTFIHIFIHIFILITFLSDLALDGPGWKMFPAKNSPLQHWEHFPPTFQISLDAPSPWVTATCASHSSELHFSSPESFWKPFFSPSDPQERYTLSASTGHQRVSSFLVWWSLVELGFDHEAENISNLQERLLLSIWILACFGLSWHNLSSSLALLPTLPVQEELHRKIFHANMCISPCRSVEGADKEGWMTE